MFAPRNMPFHMQSVSDKYYFFLNVISRKHLWGAGHQLSNILGVASSLSMCNPGHARSLQSHFELCTIKKSGTYQQRFDF